MAPSNFAACLNAVNEAGCNVILVGGLAAVLQGAPVQTYDIDLLYARSWENIECLLGALNRMDAIFRIQPERRLRPSATHLMGSGHLNLVTVFGPLDLLATVANGLTYEDLLPDTDEMLLTPQMQIRVLKLEKLVQLKEALGGEKDLATLPILRRTLQEKRAREK